MARNGMLSAAGAALVGAASAISGVFPALAGDRHSHRAAEIVHYEQRVPWYHQPPWIGTGTGYYYSHHPDHIPAYPEPLTGYPVPIFQASRPVLHAVRTHRVSAHQKWCAARYLSYEARTDTFQPYDGPRRICRSPVR